MSEIAVVKCFVFAMKVNKKLKSFTLGKGLMVSISLKNVTAALTLERLLMEFKRLVLLTALEYVEEKRELEKKLFKF